MVVIVNRPITKNQAYVKNQKQADERYTTFQRRGPLGAVLHSIGTPQPSGEVIGNNFDNPNVEASVHMVLQADGKCFKLAPDNYRMWHVGGAANNTHMGIEMTEPDCIWYDADKGYKLHIRNTSKALSHVVETYKHAVDLFASLCRKYGWDPMADGVILSHKECYARGIGSNHGDPEHLWDALGTGYTMDGFRRDVAMAVKEMEDAEQELKAEEDRKTLSNAVKAAVEAINKALKDNDCGSWSKEAREWAIAKGIIQGIGNGSDGQPNYAWEAPVTREQIVTMLYRFAKVAKVTE